MELNKENLEVAAREVEGRSRVWLEAKELGTQHASKGGERARSRCQCHAMF